MNNSNVLQKILINNRKKFLNKKYYSSEKILVMHVEDGLLGHIFHDNIVAKAIQSNKKMDIFSINYGNNNIEDIDKSYGISTIKNNRKFYLIPFLHALYCILFKNTGDKIINIKYKGVTIGDYLYDEYLAKMRYKKNIYTINRMNIKVGFEVVYNAFRNLCFGNKILKKYNYKYFIISEITYTRAVLAELALKKGITVVVANINYGSFIPFINVKYKYGKLKVWNCTKEMLKLVNKNCIKNKVQNYVSEKIIELTYVEKNNLCTELNINNGKKNVVILPHCLTDSPRMAAEGLVFKDYFEWFVCTIKMANKIDSVNWLVKAHPESYIYNESGIIEKIVENYKNIKMIPKNYNMYSVEAYADIVITCCGDAGFEYAAKGIRTICAARTAYTDCGISYRAKNKEGYFRYINNIDKISCKVSEEEKNKAIKIIKLYSQKREDNDDLISLDKIMLDKLFEMRENVDVIETWYLNKYLELQLHDKIMESNLYKKTSKRRY